jgi:hypothetical protein
MAEMQNWFTVVIPARDCAKWLAPLLARYAAWNVKPILLLDARTSDDTRDIAKKHAVRVVEITSFQFAEGLARLTRDIVGTPWVLFVNDDELPSQDLFARLAGPPPSDEAQSVAIPRRWAWYRPGEPLQYGKSQCWPDRAGNNGADHHWSLFRPDRVVFISEMHSDGFAVDTWCRLQPNEFIIHFEWVVRSRAQRAAKIRRYDRYQYGLGSFFANMYLPEDQPEGTIEYASFGTSVYDGLAKAYYAAREPWLVSARLWAAQKLSAVAKPKAGRSSPGAQTGQRITIPPRPDKEVPYGPPGEA